MASGSGKYKAWNKYRSAVTGKSAAKSRRKTYSAWNPDEELDF